MKLFELSLENEDLNAEGEFEEAKPIHPSVPEVIKKEHEDEVETLSDTLEVIDSLEAFKAKLVTVKENELDISKEEFDAISKTVSLLYLKHNVKEKMPLFIYSGSTSDIGKTNVDLAVEALSLRIDELSVNIPKKTEETTNKDNQETQ